MSEQMTRRAFLKSSACSAATIALLRPSEVQAFIIAAIAVASAVAGLVSAFTKRGDGGLSAILTSIRELQLETIAQLRNIEIGLADIDAKLQALPTQIAGLLDQARLKALDAELQGCFEGFKEAVAVRNAKRKLTSGERASAAKSQREVRDRAVSVRQTLQSTKDIAGLPHAALIAAYILPIEMSLRVFVGEPKEQIAIALQSYREWQKAMIDPTVMSAIPAYVGSWLAEAESRYGKAKTRSGFATELFANSPGSVERCYTYLEYDPGKPPRYQSGHHCSREGPCDGVPQMLDPGVPDRTGAESRVFSRATQTIDDQTGAKLINLEAADRLFDDWAIARAGMFSYKTALQTSLTSVVNDAQQPPPFAVRPNILSMHDLQISCTEIKFGFGLSPADRVRKIISDPLWGHTALKDDFDQTWDDVQGVNEARLYVAFGVNCQQVAIALLPAIERCEHLYAS